MADTGFTKPTNSILVQGNPIVRTKKIITVAECYPGRLVERDTTDGGIKVGTAAGPVIGWLGYEQASKDARPATVDTIFEVLKEVPVLSGPGMIIVARLAQSQTIVAGNRLVAAANGMLALATAEVTTAGTVPVTADADDATITGAYGSQGIVVAIAEESVTTTGAEADIMVRSLI